jgi:alkylation response protein AidB-like acyl-CoA dehydrogenase
VFFAYDSDQEDFRASLRRFLADKAPLSAVRRASETEAGYDRDLWRQMSEQLGLPGLHLPEEHGGSGSGLLEPALVLEETGRALTSSPYAAGLLASLAVTRFGSAEAQAELLPGIASGELVVTLATTEVGSPVGLRGLQTTATSRGDEVALSGARCSSSTATPPTSCSSAPPARRRPTGARLYVVRGDAPGLTRTRSEALDLTRPVARVDLDATPRSRSGRPADLSPLVDLWCALLAAGMVGGTAACLDMTVAYAKDRHQFNRPIGSFQAVKHRCAEMLVALDGAGPAAQYAVFAADQGSPELATVAPLAKAEAAEAYTFAPAGPSSCSAASASPGSRTPTCTSAGRGPTPACSAVPPPSGPGWPTPSGSRPAPARPSSTRTSRRRRRAALAELERAEGVDHDGQLVERLGAQARLDRARAAAVAVPARVQADRAAADAAALARLVVAGDVEHHLVAVDVRVVVRHRHGERVVVDLARHEVADDEAAALEHLVHRRRLVHPAGDRLEVRDVEGVRVEAAVPADDVEGVLRARRGRCRRARPGRCRGA